ncbi:SsgA family sporulation/cell division regulator, partial [Streptomyces sp. NPDC091215]|uniref:SsgA family sporulation/cell division regulator n=1 Tax=Streptomyces sp. NPDC091215 TaxID=3155192 RepID=UPI0034466916
EDQLPPGELFLINIINGTTLPVRQHVEWLSTPTGSGTDAELNLVLSSPSGVARLTAQLSAVAQWLERTYGLVPAGHETNSFDVDAELSRLLHGTR